MKRKFTTPIILLVAMLFVAGGERNQAQSPITQVGPPGKAGATIGQPGRAQRREEYAAYLDMLFGSGAKLVSLLEVPKGSSHPFTIAAESTGVKSAIRDWLRK